MASTQSSVPRVSRTALIGFFMGLFSCLLLALDGPAYRLHVWGLQFALLRVIPLALLLGLVALLLSIIGAIRARSGRGLALAGIVFGLIAAGIPLNSLRVALHSPIHDVTTDTVNPPQFSAVLPQRAAVDHANPTDVDPKTTELQKRVYPDIAPVHLAVPPSQAFDHALSTARGMGWEIAATDPTQGRIEATATTFWFGFKDDIVVRITADGSGSRVDMRSLSRIGQSDVGANARRVRDFLGKLSAG